MTEPPVAKTAESRTIPIGEGEVFGLFFLAAALTLAMIVALGSYRERMAASGDKPDYARISRAIRTGDFSGKIARKYYWGLPATAALVSAATRVDDTIAILVLSTIAAIGAVAMVFRLWGGRIAALFAILSPDWLQKSVLGGVDTVFACLLFAGLWAARRERWILAALLLSYATIVRPVGIFALLAVGIELLWRREWKRFVVVTAVALAIGAAYAVITASVQGNAMSSYDAYRSTDWSGSSPVTFPFAALVRPFIDGPAPLSNKVKTGFWMMLTVVGAVGYFVAYFSTPPARQVPRYARDDMMFFGLYVLFLVTYNSRFAWSEYPRFMIPILPFVWMGVERWLPRGRWFYWTMAALCGVFSGMSAVGFHR